MSKPYGDRGTDDVQRHMKQFGRRRLHGDPFWERERHDCVRQRLIGGPVGTKLKSEGRNDWLDCQSLVAR